MITVRCNIDNAVKGLKAVSQRQVPFAAARALTLTAQDAQKAVRDSMARNFTIRNAWSQRGIIIQPADKYRVPLMAKVMVGDIWSYLFLQEWGGTKTPTSGRHVAVPEEIRSSPTQILRTSIRPTALLQRKDVFLKDLGGGVGAIFQRLPDRRLKLLYLLIPEGRVKPRLGLMETGSQVAVQRWPINFAAAFSVALATRH